jgi:hypothetical protein
LAASITKMISPDPALMMGAFTVALRSAKSVSRFELL